MFWFATNCKRIRFTNYSVHRRIRRFLTFNKRQKWTSNCKKINLYWFTHQWLCRCNVFETYFFTFQIRLYCSNRIILAFLFISTTLKILFSFFANMVKLKSKELKANYLLLSSTTSNSDSIYSYISLPISTRIPFYID